MLFNLVCNFAFICKKRDAVAQKRGDFCMRLFVIREVFSNSREGASLMENLFCDCEQCLLDDGTILVSILDDESEFIVDLT